MTWILDTSVAAKWFVPDADVSDAAAERVLRRVVAQPRHFVVPELFFYEILSVLCRRMAQPTDVARAMDRVTSLGLRRLALDARTTRRAARLAFDHRLVGNDACYAALAYELGGTWLTFDERAHHRIAALGISEVPR